jgi:hypothetical protein
MASNRLSGSPLKGRNRGYETVPIPDLGADRQVLPERQADCVVIVTSLKGLDASAPAEAVHRVETIGASHVASLGSSRRSTWPLTRRSFRFLNLS